MPELPTTFGKYFLTEKLATGGMAEIYLAKLVGPGGFEKQLVIKQIHPKLSGQRHFVDLFVTEAKTLVSLTHGNIVPVYELGVIDDTYFIAMEYIDGPTLYRLTESLARRDARMQPAVAAWITARIVEGLAYAHRKGDGVIHRDLSPRNVMLSRDGEVKLVDFGIAVTLGDASGDDSAQSAPTGSFPYMSPEQVRKEPLSNQTDLFSVGVLFWEMLVGQRLFARTDADATLRAVTEAEIAAPSTIRAEVPAKLDEIVLRALERDTTARWADASELLAALNKYLYALDDTPTPRDVAALVARYCPPETRRLPTHADALEAVVDDTQAAPAGPSTAVIPRKRPLTVRNQSFATHVQLKDIMEGGTPLFGVPAITDADREAPADAGPSTTVSERRAPRESDSSLPPTDKPTDARTDRPTDEPTDTPLDEQPLGSRWLTLAGLGGFVFLGVAAWMFLRDQHAAVAVDAGVDAVPFYLKQDARTDVIADAAVLADAPPVADAAPPSDAPPRAPRDASVPMTVDAAEVVRPTGTATLQIGANPWAEVYIDGEKQRKNAPGEFKVSSGKHTVELVFPEEDPPKKQSFKIDLPADGRWEKFVDFSAR